MAPKTQPSTSRTVVPSLFTGPPLGTKYQIIDGSGVMSYEETRKRLNDKIDFIPEHGYTGKYLRGLEFIPRLPSDIVAERVWPQIREGIYNEQVKHTFSLEVLVCIHGS